jgi:hypothetical protein|eukprot:Tamp_04560.p2 GENE.Tamp_04560~~Tamp_04560.p2  ORF type:complete len:127 (-),score=10.94 Tamp_04560:1600-1980(-)
MKLKMDTRARLLEITFVREGMSAHADLSRSQNDCECAWECACGGASRAATGGDWVGGTGKRRQSALKGVESPADAFVPSHVLLKAVDPKKGTNGYISADVGFYASEGPVLEKGDRNGGGPVWSRYR